MPCFTVQLPEQVSGEIRKPLALALANIKLEWGEERGSVMRSCSPTTQEPGRPAKLSSNADKIPEIKEGRKFKDIRYEGHRILLLFCSISSLKKKITTI